MLILIGKMASGKDTIKQELINLGMKNCCTYTTRPMRNGERNGDNYYFVSPDEFQELNSKNFFASTSEYYTKFGIWKYGMSKNELLKTTNSVAILNPKEIKQIKENVLINTNYKICYLLANDKNIWERLMERGDDKEEITRRMLQDKTDFEEMCNYADIAIRNENISPKDLAKIIYNAYQCL